jgi:hypothetical protein
MKTAFATSVIGVLLAVATGNAQAFLITQWGYSVTSAFETTGPGAPTFTAGGGSQSIASTAISWGDSPNAPPTPGSGRSGLEIDNSAGIGSVFTNGAPGPTDVFIHHNNVVSSANATLLTATIDATLTLTPLAPPGSPVGPAVNTFAIHFAETPNSAPCAVSSPTPCNDIFVMDQSALNFPVVVPGDATYFVSFFADPALAALPSAGCTAAGVSSPCFGFTTVEGQDNRVLFDLVITSERLSVPEPSCLALLGASFAGLGWFRRRRH